MVMIPINFDSDTYWEEHQAFYFKIAVWELRRPLFPRRCQLTNRWLWLTPAMRGARIIKGLSTMEEVYWVNANDFFLHKIKYGY